MKKLIIIGAALGITIAWSGCSKDFLNRVPEGKISEQTYWNTQTDVMNALNGVYGYIGNAPNAYILDGQNAIYDDGASDNALAQYPWESNATDIAKGNVTPAMNEGWDYTGIRRANYFLENVDRVTMDNDLKERTKAEARFIRAFFYSTLALKFGDLPLITKTITPAESFGARTPGADVWKFIFSELDAVAKVLPAAYAGGAPNEKGRVTKGAALALTARLHLYRSEWADAVTYAKAVMAIPGYQLFKVAGEDGDDLLDDYSKWVDFSSPADEKKFRLGLRSYEKLFWATNKGNTEVIFDRQHMLQKDAQFDNTYLLPDILGGWSSVTPTQELVDAYESYKTGQPVAPVDVVTRAANYAKKATDPAFYNEYKNLDPRFYATIMFEGSPWNGIQKGYSFTWAKGSNNSQIGYNFRKLVDPSSWKAQVDNYSNHVIIRYAEILLTYAEAQNEVSGPDATVYDAIDQIRDRAGMPLLDRVKYNSQATLRDAIRAERRIELALEGNRFMDIRRWKIAPQVMTKTLYAIDGGKVDDRTWYDKLYLMPVPQSQSDLNPKLLPNNSGY
ncbi:putative outer membrane starch-binding protein [Chitinophaga niastensis]|uniref:Putative outer membrane starch-binding protein n=1 Tax=Chitinophaga niastensis TaxID=536980 RepID=A0A2P8HRX5_CHINA|nr:RagB/SusD family nutrient uptake outer membrane protein [Chitinophaga niastensis]PSL48980.1 putative outer membrane starch-binding protein [Chitinophaga niastensis]